MGSLTRQEAGQRASQAWQAFSVMVQMERSDPSLLNNEYWRALRDTAYARFRAAYEVI